MADVLSPLFSQHDMLQTRPSSSDTFSNSMSSQSHQQQRLHVPRSQYAAHSGTSGYRGTSTGPVSPYAFKATPNLRNDNRVSSAPAPSSGHRAMEPVTGNRQRYPASASISTPPTSSSSPSPATTMSASSFGQQFFSKDDSVLSSNFQIPPFTTAVRPLSMIEPTLDPPTKPAPDRYRRGHRRSESSISSSHHEQALDGQGNVPATSAQPDSQPPAATPARPSSSGSPTSESAKRYRRRSLNSADATAAATILASPAQLIDFSPSSPLGSHATLHQPNSRPSSANKDRPSSSSNETSPRGPTPTPKADFVTPNRTYAAVAASRRLNNPSPLSQETTDAGPGSPSQHPPPASPPTSSRPQSPAAAAMAALNDKDGQKGMKSRLRRAFSFGGHAELAAAGEKTAVERAKLRKEQFSSELDAEQDAIARQQEAAGLGNSIYSGQGNVFAGSTDNLSISSTASSASLMLRKMGKGMKKGGRSLKGLFRPKSVVGVPAADGPVQEASVGQVSMVTVEAERERVNVNASVHAQAGGGTGFPRLERNSIDQVRANGAANHAEVEDAAPGPRKGITGGDQERADAAVKKGILKRSTTGSPAGSPAIPPSDGPMIDHQLPPLLHGIERKPSPVPSTASSEPRRAGHKRNDSNMLDGEDCFGTMPRGPATSTRSLPGTPRGMARNISFSPRIQFHDAWSSSEYDRRGDIATCNRLTPMLAQQIKEELNNFKMEMEVHELSKPHTHFF